MKKGDRLLFLRERKNSKKVACPLFLFLASVAILLAIAVVRHFQKVETPHWGVSISLHAPTTQSQAFVKKVIDGDTIEIQNGERVRYIGINTPEIAHHKKGAQYYGKEAKEFNKRLVLGKNIRLEFDRERYDKYSRMLAYVYLEDGTFVNAELVKNGYARTMTIKPNTKYADLFKQLQEEAKAKKLGLWNR